MRSIILQTVAMNSCLKILIVISLLKVTFQQSTSSCESKGTCGACIREIGCVWCTEPKVNLENSKVIRCKNSTLSKEEWCPIKNIVNPESSQNTIKETPIETRRGEPAVQISPQRISLKLRRGEEQKIHFKYGQAEDYPVDLYYIMDLSASMEPHRATLSKLGNDLSNTMRRLTSKFTLGFGSFVDKTELPFVSTVPALLKNPCSGCAAPYGFKNHLSLTENTTRFSEEVHKAQVSGNLDSPEGGFDAMMQAMVCKDVIKWRTHARHLLVFSTDAGFHIAGDGKLAGIIEPNDGLCHMEDNIYTYSLLQDYPSIGQINEKAIENNINIIFAVANEYELYRSLKGEIKESSIGRLTDKSSNVVDLVKDVYSKIVDSVKLSDNFDKNIEVKYYSNCNSGFEEVTDECKQVNVGKQVNFTASIKLIDCPANGIYKKTFEIKPGALNETLIIEIEMLCDCPCEKSDSQDFEFESSKCSKFGNLTCGICQCNEGYVGTRCECDRQAIIDVSDDSNCRKDNESEICSSLGVCKCGVCECVKRRDPSEVIYGKYCDCNNFSCKRSNNLLCSGPERGTCDCGKCVCKAGWNGDACQCSASTDSCKRDSESEICAGHGQCVCGECLCDSSKGYSYSGRYCEECPTCPGQRCEELSSCVECRAFETGLSESDCDLKCGGLRINITDDFDKDFIDSNEKICFFPDKSGCTFVFKYIYEDNKELQIFVQRTKKCSVQANVLAIVSGVVGSILLAGLIALFMWKILTSYHDHKEYVKFEKERLNAKWDRGENPLFKNPTTHFHNPTYDG